VFRGAGVFGFRAGSAGAQALADHLRISNRLRRFCNGSLCVSRHFLQESASFRPDLPWFGNRSGNHRIRL